MSLLLALDQRLVPSHTRSSVTSANRAPKSIPLFPPVRSSRRRAVGTVLLAALCAAASELVDVHRLGVGADAEEGADGVEGDRVDLRRVTPPPKLVELVAVGYAEDSDDSALVGSCGEESAGGVERDVSDGRFVSLDDVGDGEGDSVEEEDVAGRG